MENIHDVLITPLKKIVDERGSIMHMLRSDDDHFEKFGEITDHPIGQIRIFYMRRLEQSHTA